MTLDSEHVQIPKGHSKYTLQRYNLQPPGLASQCIEILWSTEKEAGTHSDVSVWEER